MEDVGFWAWIVLYIETVSGVGIEKVAVAFFLIFCIVVIIVSFKFGTSFRHKLPS